MKLSHECVRDVLIYVEENLDYGYYMDFSDVKLKSYTQEELLYAADKLLEANFLSGSRENFISSPLPSIRITSLTWEGHQFLDNIRDDGVWKNTKKVISKFSSVSLSLIGNIASQVITSLIQNQLDLH